MKTTKELIQYIEIETKRGITPNEIIAHLKEKKWKEDAIEAGFKVVRQKRMIKIVLGIAIITLIISAGIFYWNKKEPVGARFIAPVETYGNTSPVETKEPVETYGNMSPNDNLIKPKPKIRKN